jgi:hypothetical protein
LKATQVVSRVQDLFRVTLPIEEIFRSPTLGELANAIAKNSAERVDRETISRILSELEELSEEDSRRLLEGDLPENRNAKGRSLPND